MDVSKYAAAVLVLASIAGCGGGGGCASSACTPAEVTPELGPTSAVSVAIGSGDKIEATAKDIKYAFRYAVTVSDAAGRPVVGAIVSPKIEMIGFWKGRFFRDDKFKVLGSGVVSISDASTGIGPVQFCANEDSNLNFTVDPGESDLNGDGFLTPEGAAVVATVEGSNISDAQGIVYFRVEYAKEDANWLSYRLTARATVTGTEGVVTKVERTGFAVGEESTQSTPFVNSRFGVTQGCNNNI